MVPLQPCCTALQHSAGLHECTVTHAACTCSVHPPLTLQALTGKGPKLGRMAEELDPVHDEVVINDCPPGVRYQLTKRTLHVSPHEVLLLIHSRTLVHQQAWLSCHSWGL